jgi:uncharacterized membrane protein
MDQNQIVIPVPVVTPNAMTNVLGILGSLGILLQPYFKTGSISLETVAIAVFVVVVCYFIGKKDPKGQAQLVNTISTIVDSTVAAKLPAALTKAQPVNALETALVDAAASQAQPAMAPNPAAIVLGG